VEQATMKRRLQRRWSYRSTRLSGEMMECCTTSIMSGKSNMKKNYL
jgi:hypothetical protein